MTDTPERCVVCGNEVDPFDRDVEQQGAALICGECARARRDDDTLLWTMDVAGGELDGELDGELE